MAPAILFFTLLSGYSERVKKGAGAPREYVTREDPRNEEGAATIMIKIVRAKLVFATQAKQREEQILFHHSSIRQLFFFAHLGAKNI
jgi:hypothetical protein